VDLNTVSVVATPKRRDEIDAWRMGDAWLAGGTWLFSEPQPDLRRLVDITGLGWPPITVRQDGVEIAATCSIAQLEAAGRSSSWRAAPLFGQCCQALLASFKVLNVATVGGNICMALPAGAMTALAAALDATGTIWTANGGERSIRIRDFVVGPRQTVLEPGDLLRRIDISADALSRSTAFRRISMSPVGRSAALLIGTRAGRGTFSLTITAATRRPVMFSFADLPSAPELRDTIDRGLLARDYYDDVHGRPDWRQAMTYDLAEQIRFELGAAP
jgi:CO/xanthine dehydrogenase FAD-binding subunit